MSIRDVRYRKLLARMALRGLSQRDLAKTVGISYSSIQYKLKGRTDFSLREAVRIKACLDSREPLEELFETLS